MAASPMIKTTSGLSPWEVEHAVESPLQSLATHVILFTGPKTAQYIAQLRQHAFACVKGRGVGIACPCWSTTGASLDIPSGAIDLAPNFIVYLALVRASTAMEDRHRALIEPNRSRRTRSPVLPMKG